MHQSTLFRILDQPGKKPRSKTIKSIADLLGVSTTDLLHTDIKAQIENVITKNPFGFNNNMAQPNEFKPDWDAMAVIVEEMQRMAKRIEELEAQLEQEPVAVWELFADGWDSIADPEWMESLPVGTKLYTTPPAAPVQEPVAWLYRDAWEIMKLSQTTPPPVGAFPVYSTPPQRPWVGLTEKDRDAMRFAMVFINMVYSKDSILDELQSMKEELLDVLAERLEQSRLKEENT
jgi:hypothetical protein